MPAPTGGQWTAFFVDLQFEGPQPPSSNRGSGYPFGQDGTFEFTTAISIVPDTFPVEDCQGDGKSRKEASFLCPPWEQTQTSRSISGGGGKWFESTSGWKWNALKKNI